MEEKKKMIPQGGAGAVIIFFVLLFAFSKWGPSLPISVLSQQKGEPMVVSAEGKVSATPDIARISAGIESSGQNLKQVQNEVNTKSQSLTKALKNLGVEEKDIKTSSYNIYPQNDYQANPPKINGYRVSTSYLITLRNFDKVNDALVIVTGAGANMVGGVSFDLSDDYKKQKTDEARKLAADLAKQKAEGLAKAAGISLGKVINVNESQGFENPRPYGALNSSLIDLGKESAQPDIQPGLSDITVTVSLSYDIR